MRGSGAGEGESKKNSGGKEITRGGREVNIVGGGRA